MPFHHHTLPNGLQIISETSPSARSAALGFFVRTGARDERATIDNARIEIDEGGPAVDERKRFAPVDTGGIGAKHRARCAQSETGQTARAHERVHDVASTNKHQN